jgi:hypothetical protein
MSVSALSVAQVAQVVAQHLGSLHGYEKALVLLVAFGPFVVLWFVVRHAQRRDAAEAEQEQGREDLSGRPPAT